MSLSGSLQLSHDLGLCRNQGYNKKFKHVGWWFPTIIRGEDRETVHIPNHKFTVNVVRNLSQKTHWRIKTHLAISHLDVHKINNIISDMRKVLAKNPQVEQQRLHRRVFLENINPENQALSILVSCFVKTSHLEEYLCVKEAILLDLLRVISHHRAQLATSIRTKRRYDSDLDNVPFANSIYNHGGVSSNMPLFVIEPSYKISGEDRTKGRGAPLTELKADAKVLESPNSEPKVSNVSLESTPHPKTYDKVNPPSKSTLKTSSIAGETSSPDQEVLDSISNIVPQNKRVTNKQLKIARQGSKLDNPSLSSIESVENLSVSKPPIVRPALEENIVLGVALKGSKRTLPIEEEMTPRITYAKEVASASRNGNGSTAKDKKDGLFRPKSSNSDDE
ncbi:MSCS-like 2 [Hibiscus trionum]|uniref:MSCS-like 2 n=1 Tax=Hibiscus trionum TaxID=183268 RepID=A0A9W7HY10_HIBTR|nr:MSCS-like 2 [Hibiscus trionum]